MILKRITAVVRTRTLEAIERSLQQIGVTGVTVTQCKGYGEYESIVRFGWSWPRVRIEIYSDSGRVEAITEAIMKAAHTGEMGDGIVAVEPVEKLYRIRTRAEAHENEI